ncbi:DoxX family protein [uncultured Nocardioides sp.]|uniref:DoxX family protein n=1 Tax=uncultured Nocardioides sp. TaxID=198441 RepID=UPI000C36AD62|nr:DoxX family protein [uncultured Nocardioides sp.]MAO79558.1 DoxX family protein [Nocardioides sp.]
MNIFLWVLAGVLAAVFLLAGARKATQPMAKLAEDMSFVNDASEAQVRAIGVVEILGALGLILPAATGVAVVLTPLAAAGLAITMVGAAVVHARRKEFPNIAVNVVLGGLALLVAILRFGPYSF